MYESLFSRECVLNEQIARQMFEILPEQSPLMVITDRAGHIWPSDSGEWAKLSIGKSFLDDLHNAIDDGSEPVLTSVGDCSVVGTSLTTERTNCGYVAVVLDSESAESTLINMSLIEALLCQVSLIGRLIEKNSMLYELQMKHFSANPQLEAGSN